MRHDRAMDVSETLLPGVGIRYEFETSNHQRVGVIVYREGNSEIVTYAKDDPDACTTLLEFDEHEGETIAEILERRASPRNSPT